ncbi:MAG: ribonuclease P protein component 4 [Candidatus Nanohaloarchaea archaeon]|nr:ribonuclease P protein component 4 [Candidatus Nanohaloarchaea archaeon]
MEEEEIARERIDILFEQASEVYDEHPDRAERYVELARKIAMKYTLSLPRKYRMRFCSDCGAYLVPGNNARVRLDEDNRQKVITCEECGEKMRFPYGSEGEDEEPADD